MTDEKEANFDPFEIPDTPMICGEWYAWWRKAEPVFKRWKERAEKWDKFGESIEKARTQDPPEWWLEWCEAEDPPKWWVEFCERL